MTGFTRIEIEARLYVARDARPERLGWVVNVKDTDTEASLSEAVTEAARRTLLEAKGKLL